MIKFSSFCLFSFLQKSIKKEHFFWQLFNIENDIVKITEELEDEKRSREGVIEELENFENEASKKKKEQAKYLKEIALCEKSITQKSNKLDKSVSIFFSHSGVFFLGGGIRSLSYLLYQFHPLNFSHRLILCFVL